MSDLIERLEHCLAYSAGLVHDEKQAMTDAIQRIAELEAERDAAFALSKCECGAEEACRNLVEKDQRIAGLETDLKIADQITHELDEKLHHAEAEVKRMSKINTLLVRIGAQKERETNDLQDKLKAAEMENANKPIDSTKLRGYLG